MVRRPSVLAGRGALGGLTARAAAGFAVTRTGLGCARGKAHNYWIPTRVLTADIAPVSDIIAPSSLWPHFTKLPLCCGDLT